MKVINKKMCVVFVLVIFEISSLFLMYKSNSNKEIKLDSIENKIEDNSLFALMIEQTLGTYTTSSSTTWPTGYVLNTLKSGCVDSDGNKIKDGMKYDKTNNKVIIDTDKTSNCYVYLSKSSLDRILASSQVWKTDRLSNDGYRYYGTQDGTDSTINNVPNYVCFGTQSKSECLADPEKYMYRIIGMFQEETTSGSYNIVDSSSAYHLKIIKRQGLNKMYAWHSDSSADINWSASDLYKGLNGNYFVNNLDYPYMQDNFWYSKITNWKWTAANTNRNDTNYFYYRLKKNEVIYLDERNRSTKPNTSPSIYETVTAKIGLMYVSDFGLTMGKDHVQEDIVDSGVDYSWITFAYDTDKTLTMEWTMTKEGITVDSNPIEVNSYLIYNASNLFRQKISQTAFVRPTFYLNSDVVICAGNGTRNDPYILG